jgi:cell division protein FtsB
MITTRKGRNGRYAVLFAVILALIGYFSYHAVNGDHGLHRRTALAAQVQELEAELAALKNQREQIEHDVALVTKRARTEPDLLDEQARSLLNFVRPGEIIVLRPATPGNPSP